MTSLTDFPILSEAILPPQIKIISRFEDIGDWEKIGNIGENVEQMEKMLQGQNISQDVRSCIESVLYYRNSYGIESSNTIEILKELSQIFLSSPSRELNYLGDKVQLLLNLYIEKARNREAHERIENKKRKIQELQENILQKKDMLTGLPGKDFGIQKINKLFTEFKNQDSAIDNLSVLFIDLDLFKNINDTYGHIFGDIVLMNCAKILQGFESEDISISRFGGEEFFIVVANKTPSVVHSLGQLIRAQIERDLSSMSELDKQKIVGDDKKAIDNITASIGIYSYNEDTLSADEGRKKADQALYEAKKKNGNNKGRNKVVVYTPEMNLCSETGTTIGDMVCKVKTILFKKIW